MKVLNVYRNSSIIYSTAISKWNYSRRNIAENNLLKFIELHSVHYFESVLNYFPESHIVSIETEAMLYL